MHFAFLLLQTQLTPEQTQQVQHMVMAMMALIPIFVAIGLAVIILPFWFICKKAGFSPWLSLLHVIPLGGLVLYYVLAFSDWKTAPAAPTAWIPPTPYPPQPPYPPQA